MTGKWWPFTYEQCHVGCSTCKWGKLYYQPSHPTRRIVCDRCQPNFDQNQLELEV